MESDITMSMHIFARWKGDDAPEFYIGESGINFIEHFHEDAYWSEDNGECRTCYIFDQLERDVDMLRLIYPEYNFGFYSLTFRKREPYDYDTQCTDNSTPSTMDDAVCTDSL